MEKYLTETELEHMTELLRIADQCRTDVMNDFVDFVFDKIDCDKCPMHGKCETEQVLRDDPENLTSDIESCWETLNRYISEEAG